MITKMLEFNHHHRLTALSPGSAGFALSPNSRSPIIPRTPILSLNLDIVSKLLVKYLLGLAINVIFKIIIYNYIASN